MKVKDLIDRLNTFPPDLQVLVQGYENGYDGVVRIEKISVAKNIDAADYDGEYDNSEKNDEYIVESVVIVGNRR